MGGAKRKADVPKILKVNGHNMSKHGASGGSPHPGGSHPHTPDLKGLPVPSSNHVLVWCGSGVDCGQTMNPKLSKSKWNLDFPMTPPHVGFSVGCSRPKLRPLVTRRETGFALGSSTTLEALAYLVPDGTCIGQIPQMG